MSVSGTVAEVLAERLAAHGVRRFFGVPGGDCSLDLIEAAAGHGIDFVVTRTETAAAIMASVTAELTGAPGVLMTTRGPGLANAVNGIAYASLDRAPLLVMADGHEAEAEHASHQRFDQMALMRPLVRAESALEAADPAAAMDRLIAIANTPPQGPVYVELIGKRVRAPAPPRPFDGYWEFPGYGGQQAVTFPDGAHLWKAIRVDMAKRGTAAPLALFDLATDPREEHDVSAEHADAIASALKRLGAGHARCDAFPMPGIDDAPSPPVRAREPRQNGPPAGKSPAKPTFLPDFPGGGRESD